MRLTSFAFVAGIAALAAACGPGTPVTDTGPRTDARAEGGVCPGGQTSCGGTCVDTNTSAANCGMCGRACAAGQTCAMGTCSGGGMDGGAEGGMCAAPMMMCGSSCVNTQTDTANCGMCGRACSAGQACTGGMCMASACPNPGDMNCSGACVNVQSDTMNCGMCGRACTAGQTCSMGMCQMAMMCPAGQTDCGSGCVDTLTSAMHCGMCGRACMATETCTGGACVPMMCPAGQMRCGGTCADTMTDNANCGTCGMACPAGQMCTAGTCRAACAAPMMMCTSGMMSACIDVSTDNNNCGSCGTVCMGGTTCQGGMCRCTGTRMTCSGACVDTQTDSSNCGMCGRACPSGVACVAGTCTCPSGLRLCGSACTNTNFDPANCGACGTPCAGSTPACVMGTCTAAVCTPPLTTMCSGTCIDRLTNNMHCGGCGNACGTGTSCQAGTCRPANDVRTSATMITLGAAETTVTGNTTNSTHDGPASTCGCTSGGNVWYRFTLATRAVVYFDTAGSAIDTALVITDSAGAAIANACNDDGGCTTGGFTNNLQSRVATLLAAGTYNIAVSNCGAQGAFTLHAQQIPTNAGSFFYDTVLAGAGNTSTRLVGTSAATGTCGGTASGEDVRWFMTCGNAPQFFSLCQSDARGGATGTYSRRIGTVNYDPSMYIRSAQSGAQIICNDDGISMGASNCQGTGGDTANFGSRINNVLVPRGINAVFVDERIGGSGMTYRLVYQVQ